ncbi:MAG: NnrU family protein [Hyphomicrobiaceae bacterium]
MGTLIAGLALFFAVHAIPMRPEIRAALAVKLGTVLYQAIFALISLAGLILIFKGYHPAVGTPLWEPPSWSHHATFLLMLPVFPLLIAAYLPGQLRRFIPHPMLMAVKLWAVAHLFSNTDLASILLFGGFLAYGVIDLISIKRRQRASGITPKAGYLANDVIANVVGLALYAVMVLWGHGALIGVTLVG